MLMKTGKRISPKNRIKIEHKNNKRPKKIDSSLEKNLAINFSKIFFINIKIGTD